MFTEARKIHLLEDVLKITNEGTLVELEAIVKKNKKKVAAKEKKLSIYDFVGIISEKEATKMKKVISETCEKIDTDAWK